APAPLRPAKHLAAAGPQALAAGPGKSIRAPRPDPVHPLHGIGLDLYRAGISTNSARGPETTGNNRHQSGKPDTRTGGPTRESGGPIHARQIRESAVQWPITSP